VLAVNAGWIAGGSVLGLIYLVFVIYCAVETFRKGHFLLFLLGFLCGVAWIFGLLTPDRKIPGEGHYVPPPPS
jgi:hypothetical protein